MKYYYLLFSFSLFFSINMLAQNKLQNLGTNVNSRYSETQPIISPDGSQLYFTKSKSSSRDDQNRNIRVSNISSSGYVSSSKELTGELNNEGWNAVCGFTADGKTMLLAGRYMPDGTLKGGFSLSQKNEENKWTTPVPLIIKDLGMDYETQTATLSADGNVIIFASNMPFNKEFHGLFDLFISFKKPSDEWSSPKNIGTAINSSAYETAPFLAADNKTLYFSSNGHNSLGGNDIFVSRRLDSTWTNWSEPQNLGSEVNTPNWESYISVTASGKYAYVGSTNRSMGKMDIFKIQLKEDLKPLDDGLLALYYPGMKKPKENFIAVVDKIVISEKEEPLSDEKIIIETIEEPSIEEIEETAENTETIVEVAENKTNTIVETKEETTTIESEKEIAIIETAEKITPISTEVTEMKKKYISNVIPIKLTPSGKSQKLENLGMNINSVYSEMAPLISPDGKKLYFSRSLPNDWKNVNRNIFTASLDANGDWQQASDIGTSLNNKGWNIMCGLTPDGNTVLLTGNYKSDGTLTGGFSKAYLTKYGWSHPRPLTIEKFPKQEDTQSGTMSTDANVIIFSSYYNINGEFYGTMDLYITFEKNDGSWTIPQNMGPNINTSHYETSPFLAADNKTLYFSTDGYGGYGSQDIYVTKRLDESWQNWSKPINIGEEVNSEDWESYFTVSAAGDFAYVGSRKSTYGKMDIFRIDLRNTIKPEPTRLVSGRVLSAINNEAIEASIRYMALSDTSIQGRAKTNPITGEYKIALTTGYEYGFFAEANKYYGKHENVDLTNLAAYSETHVDLLLTPFEEGQIMELNNIFFDLGKSELKESSFPELDKLANLLINEPSIKIEVGGHTQIGHSDKQLSLDRANAVRNYLVNERNINLDRITTVGYGDSKPKTRATSEDKRSKNRRVEVKIFKE